MAAHELKKFVIDGNSSQHEKRLNVLKNSMWRLHNTKGGNKDEAKKALAQLQVIDVNFQKQVKMYETALEDAADYDDAASQMDDLIAAKKAELQALQIKFKELNAERINKQKREALAQIITAQPSRDESQAVLNEIARQKIELAKRENELDEKFEARKELMYPLGINLSMVFAEFKDDIHARSKKIQERKAAQEAAAAAAAALKSSTPASAEPELMET